MVKLFKKNAKILVFIVLACLLGTSVFAATPGFSDGAPGETVDVPSSGTINLLDTDTGVGVDIPVVSLPAGVTQITFEVTLVSAANPVYKIVEQAMEAATMQLYAMVELNLLDQNGQKIEKLANEIVVSLPVVGNANAGMYFNDKTGEVQILPSRIRNGFIEFKTTHFSYYLLIEAPAFMIPDFDGVTPQPEPQPQPQPEPQPEPQMEPDSSSDATADVDGTEGGDPSEPVKKNPATGDTSIFIFLIIAGVAGTSIFFIIRKRRVR